MYDCCNVCQVSATVQWKPDELWGRQTKHAEIVTHIHSFVIIKNLHKYLVKLSDVSDMYVK